MTEGAEAPAPENPPAPNIDPNVKSPLETRVEMLEAGLKELLGIGKDAFDGLVARIDKLEAPPSPAPAPADVMPSMAFPITSRTGDKVPASPEARA